jgi:hypothetical protein
MNHRRAALLASGIVLPVLAAIGIPNLIEARKHGNEAQAARVLQGLSVIQQEFRERDLEGDGNQDYGSFAELVEAGLIEPELSTGTMAGYVFEVQPAPATAEFLWMAVANPVEPGSTGDRSFTTGSDGVIFYTQGRSIPLNPSCVPPWWVLAGG